MQQHRQADVELDLKGEKPSQMNTSSSQINARAHPTCALLMAVPLLPLTHLYSRGVGDIA